MSGFPALPPLNPLRLWRVDNGGAIYWVLGNEGTPAEMQAAIEEIEGCTFGGEDWPTLEVGDIREVDEAEARDTPCTLDEPPPHDKTDMWTAAQDVARRGGNRVVACSEWA